MTDLPKGYAYDGKAHYVDADDANGIPCGYYRQWVKAPTGEAIAGCAANPDAAMDVARMNARSRRNINALPAKTRLWYEIDKAKKNGRFYDCDLVTVVEILAEMISPRSGG
jgi:hypothetical protein